MTLIELAERVEAAEGPDRELDHAIYDALGKPVVRMVSASTHGTDLVNWAPFYTNSLDAAMTLTPENWSLSLGEMRGVGKWRAWLNDHNTPDGLAVRHVDADAATPALALCAAALRAQWDTYAKRQDRHGLGPKDSGPVGEADAPKGGIHDSI